VTLLQSSKVLYRSESLEERSHQGSREPLDADQRHRQALVLREAHADLQVSEDASATSATWDI